MVDWYPTLISMAGGSVMSGTGTKQIDGLDQSGMLIRGEAGVRNELVYNFDTHSYKEKPYGGHGAIR